MIGTGDLQGVVAFVRVVEAGSFTLAAERLRLTKSAVGKAVAQAEARLGVRLLNRTTRRLAPTAEGEAYYRACVRALAELEAAQAELDARRRVPSGRLRVDLPLAFGRRRVAPVLFALTAAYPDLSLELSFTERRIDLVGEGVDLAVRLGELDDETGLIARRLCRQRSVLCAAPAYLARRGAPVSTADLDTHELVVYGRDGRLRSWLVPEGSGVRDYLPRGRMTIGHGEPLLDAATAGCGIAFLPTWLAAEALRDGALVPVLGMTPVENTPIHAVWPETRSLAPKVRAAVDALAGLCADPPWDRPHSPGGSA
jgi:DNA-binding transcriptional LysR family regulator